MGAVIVQQVFACASEPDALWPFITDTERLNRAVGLGRAELHVLDGDTAARYLVKTVSGGFPLEYEELPFEWVTPERFSVKRIVRRGLARSLENVFELEPRPEGGTNVTIRVSMEPKLGLVSPVARFQIKRLIGKMAAELRAIDEELTRGAEAGYDLAPSDLAEGELVRLSRPYLEALEGADRAAGERLLEQLRTGADPDVDRMRPFELADAWGVDRRAVLGAALHAVQAGLLELTWDLVCPSCRTATERTRTLAELGAHAHCQLCDISYDLDLDRAVEATFRPAPGLRVVDEGPYCIGGPARTPHVLTQALLPAGGRVQLAAPSAPGRYRLFVRGGPTALIDVTEGAASELLVRAGDGTLEPAKAEVCPGARIGVEQSSERERHVKIERVEYASAAATAHHVSMMSEFRRQFAREVLRPGLTLRISRVALLFTDLTGSTALYTTVGDAKAFSVVQDHFELLSRIIAEHSGTIVKTIGDAVMAAFVSEEHAVRAAVAMHRAFPEFRRSNADAARVSLKVGVYAGSCYAVTANGVLDYFGQSVNVAARLQGAAGAGELVLPADLAETARANGWLEPTTPAERFDAELKGLAEPLAAERVRVDAG